ncbi:MAG: hypothetical protein ACOC0P_04740 [Planctomycetota bacterium]
MLIPGGLVAVDAFPASAGAAVRVQVVLKPAADDGGSAEPSFLLLHEGFECRTVLGCLTDAGGQVLEWLELSFQALEGLGVVGRIDAGGPEAPGGGLTNEQVDARWSRWLDAHARVPGLVLRGPWHDQTFPVVPISISHDNESDKQIRTDSSASATLTSTAGSGEAKGASDAFTWSLCRDDDALKAAGLPTYQGTLYRYLWDRSPGDTAEVDSAPPAGTGEGARSFCPLTEDAPTNGVTVDPREVLKPAKGGSLLFNPFAGRVLVRRHASIALDRFVDFLTTGVWSQIEPDAALAPDLEQTILGGSSDDPLDDASSRGWLFPDAETPTGRTLEVLHLKLRLLAGCFAEARHAVKSADRPLLNLSPASFGVAFASSSPALPRWWTSRVVLRDPGVAVEFKHPALEQSRAFRAAVPSSAPAYRPGALAFSASGRPGQGMLRIRRVDVDRQSRGADSSEIAIEGTLSTRDHVPAPTGSGVIWMRLPVMGRGVVFHAQPVASDRRGFGEFRVRTLPRLLDEELHAAVKRLSGASIGPVDFQVIELETVASDLYALAVLAVRVLFSGPERNFAEALDDVLSFANQLHSMGDGGGSRLAPDIGASSAEAEPEPATGNGPLGTLEQRIREAFAADGALRRRLGPGQLMVRNEGSRKTSHDAWSCVPEALWSQIVATTLRLLPGGCGESYIGSTDESVADPMWTIFDVPLRDLERLAVLSRRAMVSDWRSSRDIRSAIARVRSGVEL